MGEQDLDNGDVVETPGRRPLRRARRSTSQSATIRASGLARYSMASDRCGAHDADSDGTGLQLVSSRRGSGWRRRPRGVVPRRRYAANVGGFRAVVQHMLPSGSPPAPGAGPPELVAKPNLDGRITRVTTDRRTTDFTIARCGDTTTCFTRMSRSTMFRHVRIEANIRSFRIGDAASQGGPGRSARTSSSPWYSIRVEKRGPTESAAGSRRSRPARDWQFCIRAN